MDDFQDRRERLIRQRDFYKARLATGAAVLRDHLQFDAAEAELKRLETEAQTSDARQVHEALHGPPGETSPTSLSGGT